MAFDRQLEKIVARADRVLRDLEDEQVKLINEAIARSFQRFFRHLKQQWSNYDEEAYPTLLPSQRGLLLTNSLAQLTLDQGVALRGLLLARALSEREGEQSLLLSPRQREEIKTQLQELLVTAGEVGLETAESLLKLGDSFLGSTVDLPIEAIAVQASEAATRLFRYDSQFQVRASTLIIEGLAKGWGVSKTAKFLEEELNVTKRAAERIVRTETLSSLDTAVRQSYAANGVKYVLRVATQDDRVCGYCAQRAGQVYRVEEAPSVIHPNDRCFNAPFFPNDRRAKEFAIRHQAEVRKRSQDQLRSGKAPFEREQPTPVFTVNDFVEELS
jgi:SPP1 gp7 family putative phage head morphogenesis protein